MTKPATRKGVGTGKGKSNAKARKAPPVSDTKGAPSVGEKPTRSPKSREPKYSKAIAERICVAIMQGYSIRELCNTDAQLPAPSTIYLWLHRYPEFTEQMRGARDVRNQVWAEDMVGIADDGTNDWVPVTDREGNEIGERLDKEAVMRSKLRIETRKWLMGKSEPKKWGDKVQVEASGPNGGPIGVKHENAPIETPALELVAARIAANLAKLAPKP